jgi:hypothetical protein
MGLVDPEVTRLKVERELELWHENIEVYRRRGWVLLVEKTPQIDIGFLAHLSLGPHSVPVMSACIRVDFTNYDLWAPSVEFIDPISGDFAAPLLQALVESDEGVRDLLVGGHPATGRPFFCIPGVRQHHEHPQHSGDPWLLHRAKREGSLVTICDRVWRSMARNLLGLQVNLQTLPGASVQMQLRLVNAPGEVAQQMAAQAQAQAEAQQPKQAEVAPQEPDERRGLAAAMGLVMPEDPGAGGQA